jgi:hypothetical protein
MTSTQVTRLANGGSVSVRTGILRGSGPQGPMGPQGPAGTKGDKGDAGPAGSISALRSVLSSTSGVATSSDQWYPIGLPQTGVNDVLVPTADQFGIQFKETGLYIGFVVARFEQRTGTEAGGSSSGSRRLRFVDASGVRPNDECQWAGAASPSEPTIALMLFHIEPDPSQKYQLQAQSDDSSGITLSNRSMTFIRVGSGPQGVDGPPGPVGATGPQGPQGATGSAGTGYTTADALIGGTDSTLDPTGTVRTTADQGLRVPSGAQKPSVPYFLERLAKDLEPLIVSRYTSATDRNTRRATRTSGEITYLGDTGSLHFREKSGVDNLLARVFTSASAPPTGAGQAAPGVLWIQT